MDKYFFLLVVVFVVGCKMRSDNAHENNGTTAQNNNSKESITYKLQLKPPSGAKYHYDIISESETTLEVAGKDMSIRNKTSTGVIYTITKDSTGNFLMNMKYDKIRIYSNDGKVEKEMDTENAANSLDPVEKMLGLLKTANITAVVNPAGEIKSISGYKELGDKVLAGFSAADTYSRTIASQQWQQMVEEGVIRKNMDQLFRIFPDSIVRKGDKWTLNHKQKGEIDLNVITNYTLRSIDGTTAYIDAEGELTSDGAASKVLGYQVQADIKGEQKGKYELEMGSGMLVKSKITANVEGSLTMMGKEIPVEIKTTLITNGRKLTQ